MIQDELTKQGNNLTTISNFVAKHPRLFPNENRAHSFVGTGEPSIHLDDPALAGDVLGKGGWTRSQTYFDKTVFNWQQTIDDVLIVIVDAEIFPVPESGSEVPPKKFPLLLTEVA